MVGWLWIGLSVVGALVLSALIWFAGPLIYIGEAQPLEGALVRTLIIVLLLLITAVSIAWRIVARERAAAKIAQAMVEPAAEESDAQILREKMEDALATLKRAGKSSARELYDLPWYLIIGPPGAGKTTALVNSGLRFPLAGDSAAKAVQGVGGTRYCDWWFTDEAVLIDTAGRYTTQDADAKVDRRSWLAFLDILRKHRPRQPINGVIVAISIADVLNLPPTEVAAHADAIRKRLAELHEELKVDFPVYAVFTKMDLVAGFTQYFADLDEAKRQVVWGATFETADKKINHVGKVPEEIDLLIQRISERLPERLQEEPDLRARAILFGFPAQIGALRRPVAEFLNRVFEPTRYQTTATLRGFYFTSGTQEGTPFDSLIGALQKSYGVESLNFGGFSGVGKSYFLHDLMAKVIFAEAGWVSTNIAAVRRSVALHAAAFVLIGLATVGILGLWWMSYARNLALLSATAAGVDDYVKRAGPLVSQATVTDPSLLPIYELIGELPDLPAGYAKRTDPTPLRQTFGLSQRSRLQDASEQMYRDALERLMRPRLVLSLEQQLQKNIDDPTFVYEALKVYLMLGGKAPKVDKDLVISWFARDWEDRAFPGAAYAEGRALLRSHLVAMLDMDKGQGRKVSLNGPLVDQAQATLSRLPMAERAYTLLKSEAHNEPLEAWVALRKGGPNVEQVFETANGANLDTVRVPGFFTYDGFYLALLGHMKTIADNLQKESWVLGAAGEESAVKQQYVSLFSGILALYGRDFVAAWTAAINNLQLRPMLQDKPKYLRLSAASAPTSPILMIFESIRDETSLTRERPKPPGQSNAGADQAKQDALKGAASRLGSTGREALDLAMKSQRKAGEPPPEVPGAAIEDHFRSIQALFEGQPPQRPIDALLENLNELYKQLRIAADNPQDKQALGQVELQVTDLRANVSRLPQPLSGMLDKVAKDAAGDASTRSIAQITDAMAQNVTGVCQQIVPSRYPFVKSDRDVPLADFAKLFAPGGVIDKFFAANLDPLVNRTGRTWTWKPNPNLNRKLSETTLIEFQHAAEIRDAFFPTGGAAPNLSFEVKPLTLSSDAQTATLLINGATVVAQQGAANAASVVQWPGAGAGEASIAMAPDMPDRQSKLERTGAWALFRLIDAGSSIQSGNALKVSFIVFGREVSYQFTSSSLANPLNMPALRQFKCPNGL
ncbi:MAG: type VI secretion system membrane subunit TssM [Hyphomicrobiales bacterium]|nr:type VI secretion system membrane subunit TssM [Hyphomicrobiales bacterium]